MEGRVRCLGVWLCVCLSVCQVRTLYVPSEMNRTIQNLVDHYLQSVPQRQMRQGGPIVDSRDLPRETPEAMVFMSGVLQMYVKLFDHMLATAPTPTPDAVAGSGAQEVDGPMVKQQLQYLRDKVQKLQRHRYKEQEDFLKNLTKLEHIKVNDPVVQKKALWELTRLFEKATSLPNKLDGQKKRRRRRRQTLQSQGHLGA
ncbi:interferon gamma [Nelusetta ayraudi]|uniref:interferon gamma n=1 Tax=Nelusetta ayraudi TaxID=303726 RepID=UPI003F70885F